MTIMLEGVPPQVCASIGKLLRKCPKCQGYAGKPIIQIEPWEGPDNWCPTCGPLRDWMWKTFGHDFEALT